MTDNQASPADGQVAFEKARLAYCRHEFEREEARKTDLEQKSQFYLTFVTLLLGVLFFKPEFLLTARDWLEAAGSPAGWIAVAAVALGALAVSLLVALGAIIGAARLRDYRGAYPGDIVSSLFDPQVGYLDEQSERALLQIVALNYAVALEANKVVNDQKAARLKLASSALLAAVISFALTIALAVVLATGV